MKKKAKAKRVSPLAGIMYQPSNELGIVIGSTREQPRTTVTKRVWDYIKKNGLQDTEKRRIINPDSVMAPVFGKKPFDMMKMAGMLSKHLTRV